MIESVDTADDEVMVVQRSMLRRSRRLLIACAVIGVLYSVVTVGSRGGAATSASGRRLFVDLTLHPSPIVYAALAAVYLVAVHLALRPSVDAARALRILDRAVIAAVCIGLGSVLLADVWFFTAPLGGWPTPGHWMAPFPFGTQDVTTTTPVD